MEAFAFTGNLIWPSNYQSTSFCSNSISLQMNNPIKSLSLHSPPKFHISKFPICFVFNSLKPTFSNTNHTPKSHSLPFHQPKLHLKSTPNPCIPLRPTSIPLSIPPYRKISQILSEKVVLFLVGSFILLGCFKTRPCLAVPVESSSSSADMEEERETQMGKSEEEMYERVLEKEPRNVEVLKVVVYAKMRKGKTKAAVEYVERLIDAEPEEVEWRLLQGLCYEMMGQFSKAKKLFKEILEERPLLMRALHGLAMVMHKNLEGPAVFKMLNEALEVAHREKRVTEERNIRILIAQMHVVKGQLEEGLKKFQDLVNENPRDFRPYLCQGIIYSLMDKKKEAEEQFETYRNIIPEEFPQRGFIDDVVLAAKTKSGEGLRMEFKSEFSYRK